MKYDTLDEAVRAWVGEFNAIPFSLIQKAYPDMEDSGLEILATDRECSYCNCTQGTENEDGEIACDECGRTEWQEKYDYPMWSTLWTFNSNIDEEWARNNLDILRQCGLWVYESDELGIFIGINGAGYDFYEDHWKPLYLARGLRWHRTEEAQ